FHKVRLRRPPDRSIGAPELLFFTAAHTGPAPKAHGHAGSNSFQPEQRRADTRFCESRPGVIYKSAAYLPLFLPLLPFRLQESACQYRGADAGAARANGGGGGAAPERAQLLPEVHR